METFDVVFEAGGAKGIAFVGALEVLLRSGHTVRRLIGTSAGAITATCVAAGYTPKEMLETTQEKRNGKSALASFLDPPALADFPAEARDQSDFSKITKNSIDAAIKSEPIDKSLKKLPVLAQGAARGLLGELNKPLVDTLLANRYFVQMYSLTETGGLYKDGKFLDWFRERLRAKNFAETVTFKAFQEKTGRDLSLAVADTTDRELLILNHRTAPDCPILWGVRMSMSIPFVWPDIVWKKEWGTYRGRAKAGNFLVDGSVLSNFPLRYLVDPANKDVREIMGAADGKKVRNLGLLLDESKSLPDMDSMPPPASTKLGERISRLADTMTGAWDQEIMNRFPDEICRIGVKNVGTLEFDMAEARLEAVVNSGRCAMTEYLQKHRLRFQ
jgi:predicted acylesterase/phospholipase RssA